VVFCSATVLCLRETACAVSFIANTKPSVTARRYATCNPTIIWKLYKATSPLVDLKIINNLKYSMNDLLDNINKIHTTTLGIIRIEKNLGLKANNVVEWCKKKTKNADKIIKNGKNWYVYTGDSVLTINSKSYTIITEKKKKK
jgi:hypothetical protein